MLCYSCMRTVEDTDKECPFCGKPVRNEVPVHLLDPGTVLQDRYIVGNSLGSGGFGITYIGFDQKLQLRIAIKEFYPSGYVNRNSTVSAAVTADTTGERKDFFERGKVKFLTEARVLAKFSKSSGIVEVRDAFEENNTAYIIMEYLEGITLKDHIKESGGRITLRETFDILLPVIESLKDVHKQDIIHRDISPDNIMMDGGKAKLLDFGSARVFSNAGDQSLSIMLKHGYAPIEQYTSRGQQGPWTDIYALSATIYKCITGVTPDNAVDRQISDGIGLPSELGIIIDETYESALMKGLAVRHTDRYRSIDELLDGFGITDGKHIGVRQPDINAAPQNSPDPSADFRTERMPPKPAEDLRTELMPPGSDGDPRTEFAPPEPSDDLKTELLDYSKGSDKSDTEKSGGFSRSDRGISQKNTDAHKIVSGGNKEKKNLKRIIIIVSSVSAACAALILAIVFLPKVLNKTPPEIDGGTVSSAFEESSMPSDPVNANSGAEAASDSSGGASSASSASPAPGLTMVTVLGEKYLAATTTQLDLSGKGITDAQLKELVPEIKKLTNLNELLLDQNLISDITPLSELTNLQGLSLFYNQIKDISPLAKLTRLEYLNVDSNQISDITPIKDLTKLTGLSICKNPISDISLLAGLKNLTFLEAGSINNTDITPLSGLTGLTDLYLYDNGISDVTPLSSLTNLTFLSLPANQISDISPLAGLTNLVSLDLHDNRVGDITPLSDHIKLEYLDLSRSPISENDITALKAKLPNCEIIFE